MLIGLLALLIGAMKLFPETPCAKLLHQWLVEAPLEAIERLERRHLILEAIILCSGPTLAVLGSTELALIYAIDVSIYADAMIATTIAAVVTRLKSGLRALRWSRLGRSSASAAKPRSRSKRHNVARPVAHSNDDVPAWREAAAA